jgi:hypothetical protein
MVAANRSYLSPQDATHDKPRMAELPAHVRHYFDGGRRATREDFPVGANRLEMGARQSLTAHDLRIHAWLIQRQAVVNRDRSGWRAKAKRLLQW